MWSKQWIEIICNHFFFLFCVCCFSSFRFRCVCVCGGSSEQLVHQMGNNVSIAIQNFCATHNIWYDDVSIIFIRCIVWYLFSFSFIYIFILYVNVRCAFTFLRCLFVFFLVYFYSLLLLFIFRRWIFIHLCVHRDKKNVIFDIYCG